MISFAIASAAAPTVSNSALKKAREGNPYAAERNDNRRQMRLQTKENLSPDEAVMANREIVEQKGRSGPVKSEDSRPPSPHSADTDVAVCAGSIDIAGPSLHDG